MAKKKFKFDLKDPNVAGVLIALLVIAISGYLWYDMFYAPLSENIETLKEQKEKLSAELFKINQSKPVLERLRAEAAQREAVLDSLKNIFPDRKEVPRLIRDITSVNRKSNVVTTRFTPKPDVVQEYYVENKYDVAVTGNYHNLGELFSYFANLQLIVNLSNVSINANPSYAAPGGIIRHGPADGAQRIERTPSVNATFELTTFSSKR